MVSASSVPDVCNFEMVSASSVPDVCNFEMVSASSVKNLDFYNCRFTTVTLKHLLVNNDQNIHVLIMKN